MVAPVTGRAVESEEIKNEMEQVVVEKERVKSRQNSPLLMLRKNRGEPSRCNVAGLVKRLSRVRYKSRDVEQDENDYDRSMA